MIKANELRVGNLIYNIKNEFEKRQIIVSGITNTMIACKQIVTEHKFFEPIPLSEDWILKSGFKKREDGDYDLFKHSEVSIIIDKDLDCWKCDGICFSVTNFQYVHQLQNLYFALTGEELVFSN